MKYLRRNKKRGESYETYRAEGADCVACEFQKQCCPKHAEKGRIVSFRGPESAVMVAFRKKISSEEGQQIYRRRGATAEFPFAWIKERIKLAEVPIVWPDEGGPGDPVGEFGLQRDDLNPCPAQGNSRPTCCGLGRGLPRRINAKNHDQTSRPAQWLPKVEPSRARFTSGFFSPSAPATSILLERVDSPVGPSNFSRTLRESVPWPVSSLILREPVPENPGDMTGKRPHRFKRNRHQSCPRIFQFLVTPRATCRPIDISGNRVTSKSCNLCS